MVLGVFRGRGSGKWVGGVEHTLPHTHHVKFEHDKTLY